MDEAERDELKSGKGARGGEAGEARQRGTVKWFDEVRGFGFIGREGAVDVFVHASALGELDEGEEGAGPALRPGEAVTFRVAEGARGLQAREVRRSGAPPHEG